MQNSDEREEFGCVPINNLDNETVHIKFEEEPKYMQKSQHFLIDTDNENINNPTGGYQSDVMRSLHMLGGNSGVTLRTNKIEDPNNENGGQSTVINVNQVRLNFPSNRASSGAVAQQIQKKKKNPQASVDDIDDKDVEDTGVSTKWLKGDRVHLILSRTVLTIRDEHAQN